MPSAVRTAGDSGRRLFPELAEGLRAAVVRGRHDSCLFLPAGMTRGNRRRPKTAASPAADGVAKGGAHDAVANVDVVADNPYSSTRDIDRRVILNALAAAGASICDPLMSLIDTAFVGRLGLVPLAALGPNAALFNVIFFLAFMAIAVVTTDLMASANARGDRVALGRGFVLSLSASVLVGCLCAVVICSCPEAVLGLFQTPKEAMPDAVKYAVIRAAAAPCSLAMITCQAAFLATLDLRTPLIVVVLAGLANGLLDPLLIFTLNGGIGGAALATSLSQVLGFAIFAIVVWRRRERFGLTAATCEVRDRLALGDDVSLASARVLGALVNDLDWRGFVRRCARLLVRASLLLSTYTTASVLAASLGTVALAAHQVLNQIQQLQLNVTWAFLSVGQTMTANAYGSTWGPPAGRRVAQRVVMWGAIIASLMALATWTLRDVLPRILVDDPRVLATVASSLPAAVVMLALSVNNALEGCLLGADDQSFVINSYPPGVIVGLGVMWLSQRRGLGLPGVWWGLATYYGALVAWFGARYLPWVPGGRGPLHADLDRPDAGLRAAVHEAAAAVAATMKESAAGGGGGAGGALPAHATDVDTATTSASSLASAVRDAGQSERLTTFGDTVLFTADDLAGTGPATEEADAAGAA